MEKLIIGSHVSFNKEEGLLGSVKEALNYDSNTFMFYTGAPQNTIRAKIDEKTTKEGQKLMLDKNIDINDVIIHAPYIVNLANNKDENKFDFSINFLKQELKRAEILGIKKVVLHPGSHVGLGKEEGLKNIMNGGFHRNANYANSSYNVNSRATSSNGSNYMNTSNVANSIEPDFANLLLDQFQNLHG